MESDSSISGYRNKKLSSKSEEQFKRQEVRKLIQSIQPIILYFGPGLKFQVVIPLQL
jgi:hypothetical protein